MTNKYTLKDVGCYQDGSIRDSSDMLRFCIDHGYEPQTFDEEFIDEEIDDGITYLNDNWCDETVYFAFDNGDLLLLPLED